jgi:DNA-binding Lrp family transcriptional regulator
MNLDDVDRAILHVLQVEARHTTAQEIAEQVGVSPSTVRNRIDNMEEENVIEGYHPMLNYENAGLPLQVIFVCSVRPRDREDIVRKCLNVQGVVDVREMLTGRRSLYVQVIATSTGNVTRISDALHDIGLDIESSNILRQQHVQPFNHFLFPKPGADEQ